ncbi:MAG: hypothetical protein RLZZ234_55 [Candidatus Parcubacteria bacterium]|jgi:hypothetical protein
MKHTQSAAPPSDTEIEQEMHQAEKAVLDQLAQDGIQLPRGNRFVQAQIDTLAWTRAWSRKRAGTA